jgi:hypothetical protein
MQCEADGLLLAVCDWFSGWFVGGDRDEGDLPWRSLMGFSGEKGKVDFFDDVKNCLGLEGRAVQSVLNLGGESRIQSLGIEPVDNLSIAISNAHK